MSSQTHLAALRLLYTLARDGRSADLQLLGHELGLSCSATDRILSELDAAGLVDAGRVRLTMSGLVIAVGHPAARRASASRRATQAA